MHDRSSNSDGLLCPRLLGVFLFRGFFKKRGSYKLNQLTPDRYRKLSDQDSKIATRQWLQASSLVISQEDGGEQLSESVRQQIDAAVAPVIDALADSLVPIEGHSGLSSPDEQFLRSRRRLISFEATLRCIFISGTNQSPLNRYAANCLRVPAVTIGTERRSC